MLRWDQDSDIGAVHPGSDDGLQQLFTNIEQLTGYHARYRSHRWLLQLYPSRDASDQVGVGVRPWRECCEFSCRMLVFSRFSHISLRFRSI